MSNALLGQEVEMNSLIGWVGGKRLLAKTIVALLPKHTCYVEVFGGAAWVLFAKEPSKAEVYNDLDGRLVELFRTVKEHPQEFVRQLEYLVPSRELFELFREQPGLTEIQRAARFYYVLKLSFGWKGEHFGYGRTAGGRILPLQRVMTNVDDVRQRCERVTVECEDFENVLGRYDAPETCFYLDPPYIGTWDYQVRFSEGDHERLRAAVATLMARWLLTYNDCPWVREHYARRPFRVYAVSAPHTLPVGSPTEGHQLIITNYTPRKAQLAAGTRPLTRIQ